MPDVSGRNVAILDFAAKRGTLTKIVETARSVIVLDHHVTSKSEIGDFDCVVLGEHGPNSGASMSWEFFHPGIPRPFIVDCVRMGDTFSWPSDEVRKISTEFMTWFNEQDYSLGLYEEFLSENLPARFDHLVEVGQMLRRHDLTAIERTANNSAEISVQGRKGRIVNGSYLRGEVATYMYEKMDTEVGIVYCYDELRDATMYSLRADPTSTIDLSKTAQLVPGGGGHATACGFTIPGPYDPKGIREILARRFDA
jgi:oligoribonuclease NrnB/cAMP/cGMP phosphodiesterase (DHH superfamily)